MLGGDDRHMYIHHIISADDKDDATLTKPFLEELLSFLIDRKDWEITRTDICRLFQLERHTYRNLIGTYKEGRDYIVEMSQRKGQIYHEHRITKKCFKDILLRMENPLAQAARRYFGLTEELYRDNYEYLQSQRKPHDPESDRAWQMQERNLSFPDDGLGIYAILILGLDASFLKIGWTASIKKRIHNLEINELKGRKLELVRWIYLENAQEIEACLKTRLRQRQVDGEVFDLTVDEFDRALSSCIKGAQFAVEDFARTPLALKTMTPVAICRRNSAKRRVCTPKECFFVRNHLRAIGELDKGSGSFEYVEFNAKATSFQPP